MNKMPSDAYKLIKKYFKKSFERGRDAPQFFILEGVNNFGENHDLYHNIEEILGDYTQSDFLFIKDYSVELAKEHTIKVKTVTTSITYKTLATEYQYTDLGMREINLWLQQSSFSGKKILLIENIERMNTAALNAFLKTAEEPTEGTVILATTQNKTLLLDTITSRAILFSLAEKEDVLVKFRKLQTENSDLSDIFEHAEQLFSSSQNLAPKHEKLKLIAEAGIIIPFVDGLIALFSQSGKWDLAEKRLANKKILIGNVNTSQGLFYSLVKLDE